MQRKTNRDTNTQHTYTHTHTHIYTIIVTSVETNFLIDTNMIYLDKNFLFAQKKYLMCFPKRTLGGIHWRWVPIFDIWEYLLSSDNDCKPFLIISPRAGLLNLGETYAVNQTFFFQDNCIFVSVRKH